MGEAKRRGTQQERELQAIAAARSRFPEFVECNACQAKLSEIESFDTRGLDGLNVAGGAWCECGNVTYILDGTPEAVEQFQEILAAQHGGEAKLGSVRKPRG